VPRTVREQLISNLFLLTNRRTDAIRDTRVPLPLQAPPHVISALRTRIGRTGSPLPTQPLKSHP